MSKYDCRVLHSEARFQVRIAQDVYWVPVNTLGNTRYTNEEMREIVNLDPEQKRKLILTLYEAVQLFIISRFHEDNDTVLTEENGKLWEHHKPGYYSVLSNHGCCSSDAAWLNYFLSDKYEGIGYFSFFRPNGTGHVFNYIKYRDWYYLYDLCPLTDKNIDIALPETGNRSDFLKTKYITGALLKCKSLESFANFFRRLQLRGGYDHLFFKHDSLEMVPIASEINDSYITFFYPQSTHITPLLDTTASTIKVQFVSPPSQIPNWDNIIKKGRV